MKWFGYDDPRGVQDEWSGREVEVEDECTAVPGRPHGEDDCKENTGMTPDKKFS